MTLALDMSTSTPAEQRFSPEDVLRLENEGLYELVGGQLVEKTMSYLSNKTAGIISRRLGNHLEDAGIKGDVLPETLFQCFSFDEDKARRPDVAVLLGDRVPVGAPPTGALKVRPDIAIEVVSPNDLSYDVEDKLDDYRKAGVPLVWVIYPHARIVRIHRPDHTVTELTDADTLTGETILPSFSVEVGRIFPPR